MTDPASAAHGGAGAEGEPSPPPFAAARVDELPPGTLLRVTAPDGTAICLANVRGAICAVRDECSHQAFPLSVGDLLPDGSIQCAWHGARFDARTGAVRAGPACDPLLVYAVRVEEGIVRVGPPRPREDGPDGGGAR